MRSFVTNQHGTTQYQCGQPSGKLHDKLSKATFYNWSTTTWFTSESIHTSSLVSSKCGNMLNWHSATDVIFNSGTRQEFPSSSNFSAAETTAVAVLHLLEQSVTVCDYLSLKCRHATFRVHRMKRRVQTLHQLTVARQIRCHPFVLKQSRTCS